MKKTFVIGDIHGEFPLLIELMNDLPIDWDNDRIVFLGDYIDRGNFIKETINYLSQIKGDVVFLRGNHEDMFLKYLVGKDMELYLLNGGKKTLSQIDDLIWLKDFIMKTQIYFEDENYFYIHGGLEDRSIEDNIRYCDPEDLLWIRDDFIESRYDWGKKIVFGHTIFETPLIEDNKIGIDTGAYINGVITCIELPSEKIYQKKIYGTR